ncbi:MAG: peptidase, partial [Gammaproteobacteria bacterium]|nr:peptidase [Gammaproteobacteria bacterium]
MPGSFPGLPKPDIETHRFEVNGDVIGKLAVMPVKAGDTLPDVARHFALGHDAITAANPDVDVWLPESGQQVVLPLKFLLPDAPRQGVVLNLASM